MRRFELKFFLAILGALHAIIGCGRADSLSSGALGLEIDDVAAASAYRPLSDPLVETVVWKAQNWGEPTRRHAHALAYDSARQKVVLFGGRGNAGSLNDTWAWDGVRWANVSPPLSPPARSDHALAYDSVRGKMVLFGGSAGIYALDDTWEWDGNSWKQVWPISRPSPRSRHALTYDSARGKVVLFGGNTGNGLLNDTWEWDGENWNRKWPISNPPARSEHALAYDSIRGKAVLFGGSGGGSYQNDTWEWDGETWAKMSPVSIPPVQRYLALAFDSARNRVVLFGGSNGGPLSHTWEWDGTNWTNVSPAISPPAREVHALAYDSTREKIVLFGGYGGVFADFFNDTWEWDGANWKDVSSVESPPARSDHALAYDSAREEVVLFGGNVSTHRRDSDTWEWNGRRWAKRNPAWSPPARSGHALAYDSVRAKVMLFGGEGGSSYFYDTWEWDGVKWTDVTPADWGPLGREKHALAYDSAREKLVLFGGYGSSGYLNDTWEWSGANWTRMSPASSPPPRANHALVYDSMRRRVVLFGGYFSAFNTGTDYLNDTWEWDGTNWEKRNPVSNPPARHAHTLAYDSARGKVVLFGGRRGVNESWIHMNDTWEWNGVNWTKTSSASSPHARSAHAFAYDSGRGKAVLFGGFGGGYVNDTWEYHAFGGACVSDAQCNSDRCVSGICAVNLCDNVICVAKDQCHIAGRCDRQTGTCSESSAAPDGTTCDDGDFRTVNDVCTAGVCAGINLCGNVTCVAKDQCHVAGSCDYQTGKCSEPTAADNTPCDDGDFRTVNDVCTAGICAGVNLCAGVTCVAKDQCHVAGTCDYQTGKCSDPEAADSAPCDDGNACTEGDSCLAGKCVGPLPVICRAPDSCEEAPTCEPSVGCVHVPKAAGSICRPGVCDAGQAISEGRCDGTSPSCPAAVAKKCGHFICAAGACLDACSDANDCVESAFCNAGTCLAKQPQGQRCKNDDGCIDGPCADGFCCNSSCRGQCEACDVQGKEGICSPVAGAPRVSRTACFTDGTECGGSCDGQTREKCVYPTAICRNGLCDASTNTAILAARCDGQGSCPSERTQTCAPFACNGDQTLCAGDCVSDEHCATHYFCAAGICIAKLVQGESCGGDNHCISGHCIDGVCCDTVCTGQCEACDIAGSIGTCAIVSGAPHGGRQACVGQGVCRGTCDGTRPDSCVYPAGETNCGDPSCSAGKETRARSCDGEGSCGSSTQVECGLYACGATACFTSCTSNSDCSQGAICVGSSCVFDDDAGVELDASADGDPVDNEDYPSDGPSSGDVEHGRVGSEVAAEQGGCACRAAGGTSNGSHANWLGLGVAAILWRRMNGSQRRDHAA